MLRQDLPVAFLRRVSWLEDQRPSSICGSEWWYQLLHVNLQASLLWPRVGPRPGQAWRGGLRLMRLSWKHMCAVAGWFDLLSCPKINRTESGVWWFVCLIYLHVLAYIAYPGLPLSRRFISATNPIGMFGIVWWMMCDLGWLSPDSLPHASICLYRLVSMSHHRLLLDLILLRRKIQMKSAANQPASSTSVMPLLAGRRLGQKCHDAAAALVLLWWLVVFGVAWLSGATSIAFVWYYVYMYICVCVCNVIKCSVMLC